MVLAAQIGFLDGVGGCQLCAGAGQNDLAGLHNVGAVSDLQGHFRILLDQQKEIRRGIPHAV